MENRDNKFKNVLGILTTILFFPFLEKMLTPIYDMAADKVLSFSSIGIKFISRFVYSRISEGVYINISFYIFVVIISLLLSFLLCSIMLPYKKTNSCCDTNNMASCEKRRTLNFFLKARCLFFNPIRRKQFTIISSILLYLTFTLFILSTNFINNTITRTTNNIEIVSPYISDAEYKMLKSKFHSMCSRNDYDKLNSLLEQYSTENGIKLK